MNFIQTVTCLNVNAMHTDVEREKNLRRLLVLFFDNICKWPSVPKSFRDESRCMAYDLILNMFAMLTHNTLPKYLTIV